MKPRRILVTGAGGVLGGYVPRVFVHDHLILTGRSKGLIPLDVCDPEAVVQQVTTSRPDVVLHLAAATDVDRCEQEPEWAYQTNAIGTQNVALACLEFGIPMVSVSTAAVFSGDKPEPYIEFDTTQPANLYGRSKLAGEQIVASLLQRYYIVRTGWLVGGCEKDKKFIGKIVRLIADGVSPLRVVNDKWGSPTYAKDLLCGIKQLMATGYYGLYHAVNPGCCSRYEIALTVQGLLQRQGLKMVPVSSNEYPLPAPRGRSEALRNFKFDLLGLEPMRPWQDALRDYVLMELVPSFSALQVCDEVRR